MPLATIPPPVDPDAVLRRLVRIAARALDAPVAYLDCCPTGGERRFTAHGADAADARIRDLHRRVRVGRAVETADDDGSVLAVPVVAPGIVLGALSVRAPDARSWTDEDVATLRDVASHAASALERAGWPGDVLTAAREAAAASAIARRAGQSRFQDLVELSPDGVLIHAEGTVVFANSAALRLVGAGGQEALVGVGIERILAPPYLTLPVAALADTEPFRGEFTRRRLRCLDGSGIDLDVCATPFLYHGRAAVQLVLRDARRGVEPPDARLTTISSQMAFLLWTTDRDGRVNHAIGDATGPLGVLVAEAARLGHGVLGLEGPTMRAVGGTSTTAEHRVGTQHYAIRIDPLRGDDGAIHGALATGFDMTPWTLAQEARRDAVRLETIGQLAGGVAHELNNILAMIAGHAALLESVEGSPAARVRTVLDILDATRRGSDITQNLLGFAMRAVHRPLRVSLNDVAREVATALAPAIPPGSKIDLQLADGLPEVHGDRAQLARALTNLCLNGLEAMPDGGWLTIETREEYRRQGTAPRVRLRVVDEGTGMAEDVLDRALEPFFTSTPGRHVGLGLSMVYGVIRQHDGTIRLDSLPGDGTTVTIELPGLPALPTGLPAPARRDTSRRPLALVVDDERMLRQVSGALVGLLGYEAVEAADGASAVQRFRELHDRCAFVLLDVVMPGISGVDALREMLAIDPDARIVLCTGHPRDYVEGDVWGLGAVEYLGKPFTRVKLHAMIRQITGHVPDPPEEEAAPG